MIFVKENGKGITIMKKYGFLLIATVIAGFIYCGSQEETYTIDIVEGVRHIHNRGLQWGNDQKITLEHVRNFGDWDQENDDNYQLFRPTDVGVDGDSNVYILDSGNIRIQKYTSDGIYLQTIGREGEGPGEFKLPQRMQVEDNGNIYVASMVGLSTGIKLFNPEGKEIDFIKPDLITTDFYHLEDSTMIYSGLGIRPGTQPTDIEGNVVSVYNADGKKVSEFGEFTKYDNPMLNFTANVALFAVDENFVYLTFLFQNKFEKYSIDGQLQFTSDRTLNYELGVKTRSMTVNVGGQSIDVEIPEATPVSKAIQTGPENTIWLISYTRLERDDEKTEVGDIVVNEGGDFSVNIISKSEAINTDLYELTIYDNEGIHLTTIQLDTFVDNFRIFGDRLYLIDSFREMIIRQYRIIM